MENKRGQDLSIGTLILIVLGLIVLVMLVLGFWIGWDNLLGKINIFSGGGSDVQSVISACNLAATSNSKYSYCQDFKKVTLNGKTAYINCQDSSVASGITTKLNCVDTEVNLAISSLCATFSSSAYDTTLVNGKTCGSYQGVIKTCAQLDGKIQTSCASTEESVGFSDKADGKFCCVKK